MITEVYFSLKINYMKTAFIFPGQGSQAIGMGKDIAEAYPIAKETIEQADDILGFSLSFYEIK